MEAIYGEVAAFLKDLDNSNWDMDRNGEKRVLKCLQIIAPKLVFDVGANVGEWTALIPTCIRFVRSIVLKSFLQHMKISSKIQCIITK